jgi:hypothetical protein
MLNKLGECVECVAVTGRRQIDDDRKKGSPQVDGCE